MIVHSLCVYCSSSDTIPEEHRECARKLGQLLAKNGIHMITGGGHVGLMREISDAALAAGGEVTGIVPHFIERLEVIHRGLTKLIEVKSMHERKQKQFHNLFNHMIATGYAPQGCRDLYTVATDPEEVIAALKACLATHKGEDSSHI
jgi:predicted Rossmann-fold nucleotide-binding protein